jgi:hypothetical protein
LEHGLEHGFSELSDVNPQIRVLNPLSLIRPEGTCIEQNEGVFPLDFDVSKSSSHLSKTPLLRQARAKEVVKSLPDGATLGVTALNGRATRQVYAFLEQLYLNGQTVIHACSSSNGLFSYYIIYQ